MWQAKEGKRKLAEPSTWTGPVRQTKGQTHNRSIYEWRTPVLNYVGTMSLPRHTRHRGATLPLPTASSGSDRESHAASPSPELPSSSTRSYPPRPSYIANTRNRRSWSAADTPLDVPPFDSDRAPSPPTRAISPPTYARAHSSASKHASVELDTPPATATMGLMSTPYLRDNASPPPDAPLPRPSRAPPSAFHFPYGGNTDPGLSTPGLGNRSGRSSTESLPGAAVSAPPRRHTQALSSHGSHTMLRASPDGGSWVDHDLEPPYPPFMAQSNGSQPYRISDPSSHNPPNNSGTAPFRAPFLSPASRPSSLWSPPSHSHTALPTILSYAGSEIPVKAPLPSTLLSEKLTKEDKPWLTEPPDARTRASYWITLLMILLGACGAGLLCWTGYQDAGRTMIDQKQLCLVMEDTFDNLDVDNGGTWTRDVEMSGFGCVFYLLTQSSGDLNTMSVPHTGMASLKWLRRFRTTYLLTMVNFTSSRLSLRMHCQTHSRYSTEATILFRAARPSRPIPRLVQHRPVIRMVQLFLL